MARPSIERDPALLLDMVLYARDALSFIEGLDQDAFLASDLHKNAVIRCLEVIGEAARKVSAETQASLSQIPWAEIIGVRNRLIHGYESIVAETIWRTVQEDLAPLIAVLTPLLPEDGGDKT